MIFNSVSYLIFFPVVVLLYFALPKKLKNPWLLVMSYFFYMNWNPVYAFLLLGSTGITFVCSILVDRFRVQGKVPLMKCSVAVSFILNLALLSYFKYTNFLIENMLHITNALHMKTGLHTFDIVLPVGISFFIFQALGYTMDVYRGKMQATHNFFRYALFVSFFPQLVAGPIERSTNLMPQFDPERAAKFDVERIRKGLLMMAWGLFMKIVIADNLSSLVTNIYDNYLSFTGADILFATILFAFQIYCDFGGYSMIAIGSAKVLGFTLMDNFKSPYQAVSVHDFWKRWHISLTSWFTDYLYIPLGGNRKGKIRKYINVFFVFLVSGLWHGAAWTYVLWGGLNGIFMVLEEITKRGRWNLQDKLHIDRSSLSHRFFSSIFTFLLVDFTWMFFRAESISQAIGLMRQAKANPGFHRLFGLVITDTGLDSVTVLVLALSMLVLFIVDTMKNKGRDVSGMVLSQAAPLRYVLYALLLLTIMFFGVYGYEYAQTAFIYFQF